jgi:hypothetical protein
VQDALTLSPLSDHEVGRPRRPSLRLLVAGIAAVTLPVLAGAAYLANHDTPTKTIGSPGGPPGCGSTTTTSEQPWSIPPTTTPPATTSTVPTDLTTTTSASPSSTPSTGTPSTTSGGGSSTVPLRPLTQQDGPTTTDPCAPTTTTSDGSTSSSAAPTTVLNGECVVVSNGDSVGYIDTRREVAEGVTVQFDVSVHNADGEGLSTYPGAETIQVGTRDGNYATIQGGDGSLGAVELVIGQYAVVVQGRKITKDQTVEVAASVRETGDAGTFTFTPLPGFDPDTC